MSQDALAFQNERQHDPEDGERPNPRLWLLGAGFSIVVESSMASSLCALSLVHVITSENDMFDDGCFGAK